MFQVLLSVFCIVMVVYFGASPYKHVLIEAME